MDLNREEVRFVNRRILPSHVAKYKFLFHDSLPNGGILSKLQNGGSKTSVDESYPYKLNEQPSVFFSKNGSVMSDGDDYGGGDCGGGGGGGGGGHYGGGYNNDASYGGAFGGNRDNDTSYGGAFGGNHNTYNSSYGGDSNTTPNNVSSYYSSSLEQERSERVEETRSSRLADVETHSYADQAATLPLNGRHTQNTLEAPLIQQSRPEPQPDQPDQRDQRDDTQPSPPGSADVGPNTNPYLEQDLAIHHSEDSPTEDKIITFDSDCACSEILNADSLNNRDNDNNDGSIFHELSALNHMGGEKTASSSDAKEESCGMDCLYFTLQCCECTIL